MIPLADLARHYRAHKTEIDDALAGVMSDGWFVLGRRLATFEASFAAYCGVEHAVGVGNGTDAIALALRALGVQPGHEVVTTPLSAAFTALAIHQIGAVAVFADIEEGTCTLAPDRVEAAVTPRTRAIVPVHLYGQPADMGPILDVARRRGLVVVEDAAQAHGARYRGRRVGGLADAAAFSFYPSKNLGAYGDGGAVTTNDQAVADRVRQLRDGGQTSRYVHALRGTNSRLDELQAAVLQVRLGGLDPDNARRRSIARRYTEALGSVGAAAPLAVAPGSEHAFHLFVVRARRRSDVARQLELSGVATAVHYPTPLHMQPAFGGPELAGRFPVAERAADEVLSVPVFPELSDEEADRVAMALAGLK